MILNNELFEDVYGPCSLCILVRLFFVSVLTALAHVLNTLRVYASKNIIKTKYCNESQNVPKTQFLGLSKMLRHNFLAQLLQLLDFQYLLFATSKFSNYHSSRLPSLRLLLTLFMNLTSILLDCLGRALESRIKYHTLHVDS